MARALRAIVAEIHQITPATVPKMLRCLPTQPNELRGHAFQARHVSATGCMTQMENSLFKNESSSERFKRRVKLFFVRGLTQRDCRLELILF